MKEKDNILNFRDVLEKGGRIDYAPLEFGFIVFDVNGDLVETDLDMKTFLEMQSNGKFKRFDGMRQGHSYFRGEVEMLSLKKGGDSTSS